MDFFVVPTATLQLLYVLVVMNHERRRIIRFNITASPTAAWTAQQMINAFPYDTAPKYLLQDRDACLIGRFFGSRPNFATHRTRTGGFTFRRESPTR
jgi:hypothetical protein